MTATTKSQAGAPEESPLLQLLTALLHLHEAHVVTLERIESRLNAIFDVLTASEDEEIQLTLDDKGTREGEQGNGLG